MSATPQVITIRRTKLRRDSYRHTIQLDHETHTVQGNALAAGAWLKEHVNGWMGAYESGGATVRNDDDCTSTFHRRKLEP
jgi:hypothetical protein